MVLMVVTALACLSAPVFASGREVENHSREDNKGGEHGERQDREHDSGHGGISGGGGGVKGVVPVINVGLSSYSTSTATSTPSISYTAPTIKVTTPSNPSTNPATNTEHPLTNNVNVNTPSGGRGWGLYGVNQGFPQHNSESFQIATPIGGIGLANSEEYEKITRRIDIVLHVHDLKLITDAEARTQITEALAQLKSATEPCRVLGVGWKSRGKHLLNLFGTACTDSWR